ncbi:uncharacterized protein HMPREF1541_07642 [Cyphellophora europaea CBS 101466]|uniref:Kinesin-like protein n=1 Tax=Cyphellophora europaea (strain CBS 101466) TaxID=1220924 RepID=W2RQM6_CYPE1|nr:uncharacterized protein HMPREF1541_07642 [Cyphellophora europaea CBS 101466]ETN38019.1 hypothetical protein HMPREF1541_07642 [Cyphellophora europaea CBS 101466]
MSASTSLFQVYLRLRPPIQASSKDRTDPWLIVEPPASAETGEEVANSETMRHPTHITLQPPNESRKRAIERFGFTKIFREDAGQLEVFEEIQVVENVKNVLQTGRDGLIATLGVTGSGKSHTILGSKSQRGLTQMSLDLLFQSIGHNLRCPTHPNRMTDAGLLSSLQMSDPSEAHIQSATAFLDSIYSDGDRARQSRAQTPMSRAQTPMMVRTDSGELPASFPSSPLYSCTGPNADDNVIVRDYGVLHHSARFNEPKKKELWRPPAKLPFWRRLTPKKQTAKLVVQETPSNHSRKMPLPRPSGLPQIPNVSSFAVDPNPDTDYVVMVSMYEVYNDRIFDLLSSPAAGANATTTRQAAALQKGLTRRPLLFKNTELSPDRKVVAGLRKIVCGSYEEAMMVLETGLTERRVAGTGSNSVSSRSHGFFCIEVKRNTHGRNNGRYGPENWKGSTISIVDLAGSERARSAKTTGSTLAEAGKINESLMYLGQCLQVQSDCQHDGSKPIVPFRQCKLTELLFSNSFPSSSNPSATTRAAQKAVMIVTADPQGDFNATSQILRYSALAREVTVPRVPSVTSQMGVKYPNLNNGRSSPQDQYYYAQELEQATNEVMRLSEECDTLAVRLAQEEIKRTEAELKLQLVEERAMDQEAQIREECWTEMEEHIAQEKERWRAAWEEERLRGEKYVDGKLDILSRSPTKTRAR